MATCELRVQMDEAEKGLGDAFDFFFAQAFAVIF
jgi:hypothetical protein